MKINHFNKLTILGACMFALASCTKDLDRTPIVGATSAVVYGTPTSIKQVLAKLYAGLTLSGLDATSGFPTADISSSDVGANVYFRNWWEAQELSTDEAKIAWGDGDLQQYNTMNWTSQNTYLILWYNRIFYQVGICNEFIRQVPASKIASFSGTDATNVQTYVYEARFLRALAYYHAIDNFGNVPFTTENDAVGKTSPKQISRDSLFRYVENELLAVQAVLPAPGTNEYGRVDQAAAWTLLAKLYLNAKVYTGTDRSTDCITYCNKIINSGKYSLAAKYTNLFKIDNHTTSANEIIFALRANGVSTQSYGNTTFLIHAQVGGTMNAKDTFGIASGGWSGLRTTKNFVNLFGGNSTDQRTLFYTAGQTLDLTSLTDFTSGYAIQKFKNVSSTGAAGSDPSGNFSDLDFPMFRLADVYLMYAEAVLRGGTGGNTATALGYVNAIRTRAFGGSTSGNITAAALTLQYVLDERGRELYWEGYRRTDLIRYGLFTGSTYLWPWKGGTLNGTGIDAHFNLYPLSATDVNINSNLTQNSGY